MLKIQFRRGTTVQNDGFTGAAGSLSLDTELNQLRIHDGVTQGGFLVPVPGDIQAIQQQLDELGIAGVSGLETALAAKVAVDQLGVADGVATLNSSGKIPSAQLPAYVDDVLEFASEASFPATGETSVIYIALDTNDIYRWSGSAYINMTEANAGPATTDGLTEGSTNLYFTDARARNAISVSGDLSYDGATGVISFSESVTTVAGKSGTVTLVKADVGLGSVENQGNATQLEAEAAAVETANMTPQATRWLLESMGFSDAGGDWVLDQGTIV